MSDGAKGECSSVDIFPLTAAIVDSRIGLDAFDLALAAKRTAFGEGGPAMPGCWTCEQPWTPKRSLASVAVVELIDLSGGFLAGLCPSCTLGGQTTELLIQALGRDFDIPRTDLQTVHSGGRA